MILLTPKEEAQLVQNSIDATLALLDQGFQGDLAKGITRLVNIQKRTSPIAGIDNEPTIELITAHAMGLMGETFELIQKLGWKYWKTNPEMTEEAIEDLAEEYADILAFLGLLTIHLCDKTGLTPAKLERAFLLKTQKNVKRFLGTSGEPGYDGIVD